VAFLLALGRPTYVTLAVLPASVLLLRDWRRHWKLVIGAMGFIVAFVLVHLAYVRGFGPQLAWPGADPAAQFAAVLADPTVFLRALWRTDRVRKTYEAIGILGWSDAALPLAAYSISLRVLALSLAATALSFANSNMRALAVMSGWSWSALVGVAVAAIIASVVLSAFSLYLIANPVGDTSVHLHGRYFLPFASIFVCAILAPLLAGPGLRHLRWFKGPALAIAIDATSILLLGAMIASFVVTNMTMVTRYYVN